MTISIGVISSSNCGSSLSKGGDEPGYPAWSPPPNAVFDLVLNAVIKTPAEAPISDKDGQLVSSGIKAENFVVNRIPCNSARNDHPMNHQAPCRRAPCRKHNLLKRDAYYQRWRVWQWNVLSVKSMPIASIVCRKFANRRLPACARSALILDAGWQTRAGGANYYAILSGLLAALFSLLRCRVMRGKGNVLRHFPMIPGRPRLFWRRLLILMQFSAYSGHRRLHARKTRRRTHRKEKLTEADVTAESVFLCSSGARC